MGHFDIATGVEDIQASIDCLRAMPGVTKVGAVGYCLGGLMAFLAAARTNADASVGYYGVNIPKFLGEAVKKPLMLHIAAQDGFVPKPMQDIMIAGLKDNSLVTLHRYEGVDHAFARMGGKNWNAEAAALANGRTAEFFKAHLT
jgi:carboxymethylenebutenolidase